MIEASLTVDNLTLVRVAIKLAQLPTVCQQGSRKRPLERRTRARSIQEKGVSERTLNYVNPGTVFGAMTVLRQRPLPLGEGYTHRSLGLGQGTGREPGAGTGERLRFFQVTLDDKPK